MRIELPEEVEDGNRRYFSNDGTPVIIDFVKDEPVAAYRLAADRGGFSWFDLEEDLFYETYADGKELKDADDFASRVIDRFVRDRLPSASDLGYTG